LLPHKRPRCLALVFFFHFNCIYYALVHCRYFGQLPVHSTNTTTFDTPRWLLLGILARRLELRNNRASLRVRNDEAEEGGAAEEARLGAQKIDTNTTGNEVGAEAMRSLGVGADEAREMAQATVEDMPRRRAKRL
jgi:hypothetical protein